MSFSIEEHKSHKELGHNVGILVADGLSTRHCMDCQRDAYHTASAGPTIVKFLEQHPEIKVKDEEIEDLVDELDRYK